MSADEKKGGGAGAIIAIIIILIIIGGAAFFFMSKGGKAPISIPGITKPKGPEVGIEMEVLPEQSVMFFKVNLKKLEDKKLKDELLEMMKNSPKFQEQMEKMKKDSDIDLEKDIMSWMGESAAISMFDAPSSDAEMDAEGKRDTSNDHFALVIEVKDMKAAKAKVDELMKKSKEDFKKEEYEGTGIWVPQDTEKKLPAIAFIKETLVMGNSLDDVKKCVDAANKKGKQLKDNKKLTDVINKLPANSVITAYMDLNVIMEKGMEAQKAMGQQRPGMEEMEKFVKALGGLGYGVAFEKGDLVGKGFVGMDKTVDSSIVKAIFETNPTMGTPTTPELMPKDTSFYTAFDIKLLYNIIIKVVKTQPEGEKNFTEFKEKFQKEVGLDFEKDIVDNFAGEIAYSLDVASLLKNMGPRQAPGQKEPPAVVAAIKLKDKAKAEETIGTLMKKAPPQMAAGQEYNGVKLYGMPNMFSFGVFEDYILLGTGAGTATLNTIIDNKMAKDKSLATNLAYNKIKDKMKGKTLSLQIIKIDKFIPLMKMGINMAQAQGQQDEATAKQAEMALKKLEEYDSMCSFSEIANDGINFEFIVVKKEAK